MKLYYKWFQKKEFLCDKTNGKRFFFLNNVFGGSRFVSHKGNTSGLAGYLFKMLLFLVEWKNIKCFSTFKTSIHVVIWIWIIIWYTDFRLDKLSSKKLTCLKRLKQKPVDFCLSLSVNIIQLNRSKDLDNSLTLKPYMRYFLL